MDTENNGLPEDWEDQILRAYTVIHGSEGADTFGVVGKAKKYIKGQITNPEFEKKIKRGQGGLFEEKRDVRARLAEPPPAPGEERGPKPAPPAEGGADSDWADLDWAPREDESPQPRQNLIDRLVTRILVGNPEKQRRKAEEALAEMQEGDGERESDYYEKFLSDEVADALSAMFDATGRGDTGSDFLNFLKDWRYGWLVTSRKKPRPWLEENVGEGDGEPQNPDLTPGQDGTPGRPRVPAEPPQTDRDALDRNPDWERTPDSAPSPQENGQMYTPGSRHRTPDGYEAEYKYDPATGQGGWVLTGPDGTKFSNTFEDVKELEKFIEHQRQKNPPMDPEEVAKRVEERDRERAEARKEREAEIQEAARKFAEENKNAPEDSARGRVREILQNPEKYSPEQIADALQRYRIYTAPYRLDPEKLTADYLKDFAKDNPDVASEDGFPTPELTQRIFAQMKEMADDHNKQFDRVEDALLQRWQDATERQAAERRRNPMPEDGGEIPGIPESDDDSDRVKELRRDIIAAEQRWQQEHDRFDQEFEELEQWEKTFQGELDALAGMEPQRGDYQTDEAFEADHQEWAHKKAVVEQKLADVGAQAAEGWEAYQKGKAEADAEMVRMLEELADEKGIPDKERWWLGGEVGDQEAEAEAEAELGQQDRERAEQVGKVDRDHDDIPGIPASADDPEDVVRMREEVFNAKDAVDAAAKDVAAGEELVREAQGRLAEARDGKPYEWQYDDPAEYEAARKQWEQEVADAESAVRDAEEQRAAAEGERETAQGRLVGLLNALADAKGVPAADRWWVEEEEGAGGPERPPQGPGGQDGQGQGGQGQGGGPEIINGLSQRKPYEGISDGNIPGWPVSENPTREEQRLRDLVKSGARDWEYKLWAANHHRARFKMLADLWGDPNNPMSEATMRSQYEKMFPPPADRSTDQSPGGYNPTKYDQWMKTYNEQKRFFYGHRKGGVEAKERRAQVSRITQRQQTFNESMDKLAEELGYTGEQWWRTGGEPPENPKLNPKPERPEVLNEFKVPPDPAPEDRQDWEAGTLEYDEYPSNEEIDTGRVIPKDVDRPLSPMQAAWWQAWHGPRKIQHTRKVDVLDAYNANNRRRAAAGLSEQFFVNNYDKVPGGGKYGKPLTERIDGLVRFQNVAGYSITQKNDGTWEVRDPSGQSLGTSSSKDAKDAERIVGDHMRANGVVLPDPPKPSLEQRARAVWAKKLARERMQALRENDSWDGTVEKDLFRKKAAAVKSALRQIDPVDPEALGRRSTYNGMPRADLLPQMLSNPSMFDLSEFIEMRNVLVSWIPDPQTPSQVVHRMKKVVDALNTLIDHRNLELLEQQQQRKSEDLQWPRVRQRWMEHFA